MSAYSLIPWRTSGGSGVGPDLSGITAGGDQILAGYQSVDRNGDVVYGGIYPQNDDVVFSDAESLFGPEVISVSIPVSGYYSGSAAGGFGLWVSWSDLASAIGLTADKLKPGVTVIGVTGR